MDTDSTKWLTLKSGSDIRGREDQLTDEICGRIGYAYACALSKLLDKTTDRLTIAVGCDTRPSGLRIKRALTRGITAADCDVIDAGFCVLPALFKCTALDQTADGAVMVTGGDAPIALNGFKFLTSKGGFEDIPGLLKLAAEVSVPERLVTRANLMENYRDRLVDRAKALLEDDAAKPLLGLYLVIDTATTGGVFFADLMEDLGADVERLEGINPEEEVPKYGADMGVSFDIDSSRAFIYDSTGEPVDGNRLVALMAAILLDQKPGLTFVTDSVTSTGLTAFIQEWGGVHYRFKRGYRHVIQEAVRLNDEGIDCPLAIETTGHAAFRENGFLDDGIYLALRIACRALDCKREGASVFDPLEDLSQAVETLTLRLQATDEEDPVSACQEFVEVILSHTLENPAWQMAPDNREGVRITFNLGEGINNAWFQLRMSVHDPVMVLHAESDVPGGVRTVLNALYQLIQNTDLLKLQPLRDFLNH